MISLRSMNPADIAAGMLLKAESGWNQVEGDWRRFLDLGTRGCFVAEQDGTVVGTVTTCRFGSIGWIAMLLVKASERGAGIGRRLLEYAVNHLEREGATSIRLDATPLGLPLYQSLGFQVDFRLLRYHGKPRLIEPLESNESLCCAEASDILGLDRVVTGTDRRTLLRRLVVDHPSHCLIAPSLLGPIQGFVLWRPGWSSDQIGPCIAEPDSGAALLEEAMRRIGDRSVIVDIPAEHERAIAWAESRGVAATRELWRMTRGEAVVEELPRLWASSGPEMG
jgi:GNAT superfamily N-acetyltransferase